MEFLPQLIQKLEGRADVEILWTQPIHSGEPADVVKSPPRDQEARLRDVEDALKQVLRKLDELKRRPKPSTVNEGGSPSRGRGNHGAAGRSPMPAIQLSRR